MFLPFKRSLNLHYQYRWKLKYNAEPLKILNVIVYLQKIEEYREAYEKYLATLSPEDRAKAEEMDGWNKHKKSEKSPVKESASSPEVCKVRNMHVKLIFPERTCRPHHNEISTAFFFRAIPIKCTFTQWKERFKISHSRALKMKLAVSIREVSELKYNKKIVYIWTIGQFCFSYANCVPQVCLSFLQHGGRSNKPVNAMFLWMDEKRASYQEKYPEMSPTEITRHMAQAWNKLSDEKKVSYSQPRSKQQTPCSCSQGAFTPSECKSDITNKWVLLFSVQLFTLSDVKDQENSHLRSLQFGVNEA